MTEMTHQRCSELLPSLLEGRLAADEAVEVERHLEGCAQCRAELRGLTALRDDLTPLTDFERATLRRAVKDALPPAVEARPSIWSKAAPFISVAAALLILGFGLTTINLGGNDSAETAGGSADAGESFESGAGSATEAEEEADSGKESAAGGGDGEQAASDAAEPEAAGETLEADAPGGGEVAPGGEESGFGTTSAARRQRYPVYKFGGEIVAEKLESQAREGRVYRSAARDLKPKNADRDGNELLATLRGHAEKSGRSGENLETCARSVMDSSAGARLPVFANFGRQSERRSLAIGFIEAAGSTYDRYLIGIWTPPEGCANPQFRKGPLR